MTGGALRGLGPMRMKAERGRLGGGAKVLLSQVLQLNLPLVKITMLREVLFLFSCGMIFKENVKTKKKKEKDQRLCSFRHYTVRLSESHLESFFVLKHSCHL